jgi:DNA-binding MarR family transcriptional regulator
MPSDIQERISEDQLFEEIFRVACLMHRDVLKDQHIGYEAGELTRLHFGTLGALSTYQPITAGELAARMQILKPQMTVLLDKLEANGLVLRNPDPDDRRRTLVTMTDTGGTALSQATANMGQAMKRKLGTLDDDARAELSRALRCIVAILSRFSKE